MKKLIIVLLVIVSLLLVGCENNMTGETTLTEKVCECPNIDLSEYDKRIDDLEQQTRTLRKQLGILVNELYVTKEELNITKSSQTELEQLNKELENEIDRVNTGLSTRIDTERAIQNCEDEGGEWTGNYCRETQQGWLIA